MFCSFFKKKNIGLSKVQKCSFQAFSTFVTTGVCCYILLSPVIDNNVEMSIASTWFCTYIILKWCIFFVETVRFSWVEKRKKKPQNVWAECVAVRQERQENDWLGEYRTSGEMCVFTCVIGCARSWCWVGKYKGGWKCVLLSGVFLQYQHDWKGTLASCANNSENIWVQSTLAHLIYFLFECSKRHFNNKSFIKIPLMMGASSYNSCKVCILNIS